MFNNTKTHVPNGFNTLGCWVRIVERINEEICILAKRDSLSVDELLGHDNQKSPIYTDYSSSTFLLENIGIGLYNGGVDDNFGVFIRPLTRRIDWWYNGRKEIVTDGIKPIPRQPYNNGGKDEWQLNYCSIDQIQQEVLRTHYECANDFYQIENPDEPVRQNWNEGFLRYQLKDITGLLINLESQNSVYQALAFRKAFSLRVNLFSYDQEYGQCQYHASSKLCKDLKISQSSINFQNLVLHYQTQFNDEIDRVEQLANCTYAR